MFQSDLKVLLGLILPNQYCHIIMKANSGMFLGDILSWTMPKPLSSVLYSAIILYDMLIQLAIN